MRLDESTWRQVLAVLPSTDGKVGNALAVAFVDADDFASKSGSAWLWWPDSGQPGGRCDFDGGFPPKWGMLLVMSESALDSLCVEGDACLAGLVRRVQIRPFLLQQMEILEAAGLADFIESLELATPKH
ncbi:MAG: hypothetical protein NTV11_19585 [Rhodocyclales bacterium]|nr:hypothetical protein [Rhodocyclales bacterium]